MKRVRLRPHAKINLGLKILGRRPDGYHELDTRFQTIDLTDELELVEEDRELKLEVEGADLPCGSTNLVIRAGELLRRDGGIDRGARMRLVKRIPVAAGLGGGSSDAAATLLGLDALWGLGLGPRGLEPLAARLGADVPFFLHGGTARGSGRGDLVEPLDDQPPCGIALVIPGFTSSTEQAYLDWDRRYPAGSTPAEGDGENPLENDFQALLEAAHPVLAGYRESLLAGGAFGAALSGSGPAVFGLFSDPGQLREAIRSRAWEPARALECRAVGRDDYRRRLGPALSD